MSRSRSDIICWNVAVVWLYYFRLPVRTRLSIAVIPVTLFFVPEAVLLFAGVVLVKGVTTVEFIARQSHCVDAKGSGSAMIWEISLVQRQR